jgi:hydroxyethylthiazole kinase-like uncharacterized protein yjeF
VKAEMKIATPEQMNAIDGCSINEYGIPGILLMENAALAVVSEAASMMGGCRGKTVTAVAGRGNNGGDAFAAARLLHSRGAEVKTYLVGRKAGISGDALFNMTLFEKTGGNVIELAEEQDLETLTADMSRSELVLDGIFGTGLGREVGGLAASAISRMNESGKAILAIDIPSGIDGADGSIKGICVRADATVTFCMLKIGLVLNPGCEYAGKLITAEIGTPKGAVDKQNIRTELTDRELVSRLIPVRRSDSHKGDYGKVMILTGSNGMTGCGCLSSMAALRCGAGLVYTAVPGSLAPIYGAAAVEPVVLPLEDGGRGCLCAHSAGQILEYMERMDAAAIGPGLTASEDIRLIVEQIIENSRIPLVLDADVLNSISGNPAVLKKLKAAAVITPHPGEMARLTGLGIADIQRDRVGTASRFAAEYGVTVVLKGSRTVTAIPDGRIFINPTGNAGMATAGSGDVLAGVIAGLAAQGLSICDAAVAGVYLHGLAGDNAAESIGMHGIVAGDILVRIPRIIKELTENRD